MSMHTTVASMVNEWGAWVCVCVLCRGLGLLPLVPHENAHKDVDCLVGGCGVGEREREREMAGMSALRG